MLDLAIVHLAGFVGEAIADIVGVLDDVVAQFLELGAQLALLRHHQRRRARGGRLGDRRPLRRCGCGYRLSALAALLADDARGHDRLVDLDRVADRAAYELALDLLIVGRRALEPAFEGVVVLAAECVADHADPRTRCRCSGPAFGSATENRRPCCSDGTALRAVSTLAGSILARTTPGSVPPSARTSPQGATISEWP